jgi:Uma2 family endonuclease
MLKVVNAISWEDYELGEEESEERHEYVNGQVFAMAGGTDNHNRISGNIFGELRSALKGQPCEAFMVGMKVKIALANDLRGYYPDVFVACESNDGSSLHREKPKVIVEVTSGSTARTDRQEKRLAYLSLDSLEEYVIVEQSEMKATIYRRVSDWQPMETEGGDAVLEFQSLGVTLTFAEIYERVDWTRNDEPPLGL